MSREIPTDSVWRRLPEDLSRRQILFLDGLRISAQMAAESFQRLEELLVDVSEGRASDPAQISVKALVHAYGIVDAVNRFRDLLSVLPGMKKGAPFKLFMNRTASAKQVRNHLQHLNQELDAVGELRSAALGVITWLGPSTEPKLPPSAWLIVPGTFYPEQRAMGPVIDREERVNAGQVSGVQLVAGPHVAKLAELVNHVFEWLSGIEPSLKAHAEGKKHHGSDMLMQMHLVSQAPKGAVEGLPAVPLDRAAG